MEPNIIKYIKKLNNKPSVQRRLLEYFIAQGASTIPEMSKGIGVSLPTATNALNELIKGQGDWQERQLPGAHPNGLRPYA